jgi:ubiquinol-cytochrome c reductase cytochrome b subunit
MQVVIDGAYRAPREVNFWLGLVLMMIVLGLSLTGYLLPWDQKGYWATRVATNLMGLAPGGDKLQQLVVGGPDYGHHTLTRFFVLHAGVLPGLLILFLVLHVALFRRHGLCARQPVRRPDCTFWPDQVLKDAVACLAVLVVVLVLVLKPALTESYRLDLTKAGAELGAPADPTDPYNAARPEWYFLFLFQLLKYFPGKAEVVGAILLPGAVTLVLFLMPILGRWRLGHVFNIGFLLVLIFGGIVPLTVLAWRDDHHGPDSAGYLAAVRDADEAAERVRELAARPEGIPPTGAITLVRNDNKTQGKKLFAKYCASCHDLPEIAENQSESTDGGAKLAGFASRAWIAGLLDPQRIVSHEYFGASKHRDGDMVEFVKGDLASWKPEEIEQVVAALSAEAELKPQAEIDKRDAAKIEAGRKLIADDERCAQCHKFREAGEVGIAPDLTGYGSRQWLIDYISNPGAERFYIEPSMPAFAAHPAGSSENILTPQQIERIIYWLRQDWQAESPEHP